MRRGKKGGLAWVTVLVVLSPQEAQGEDRVGGETLFTMHVGHPSRYVSQKLVGEAKAGDRVSYKDQVKKKKKT